MYVGEKTCSKTNVYSTRDRTGGTKSTISKTYDARVPCSPALCIALLLAPIPGPFNQLPVRSRWRLITMHARPPAEGKLTARKKKKKLRRTRAGGDSGRRDRPGRSRPARLCELIFLPLGTHSRLPEDFTRSRGHARGPICTRASATSGGEGSESRPPCMHWLKTKTQPQRARATL
jgi:hypothetical protein